MCLIHSLEIYKFFLDHLDYHYAHWKLPVAHNYTILRNLYEIISMLKVLSIITYISHEGVCLQIIWIEGAALISNIFDSAMIWQNFSLEVHVLDVHQYKSAQFWYQVFLIVIYLPCTPLTCTFEWSMETMRSCATHHLLKY